jgi:ribose transport system substrate-binding protein
MKSTLPQDRYILDTVLRACDVLGAFQSEAELLRISDVAERTGLSRPTALRFVYTLERRGLLERVGNHAYRLGIRPLKQKPRRFGYGAHTSEFAFSRDVADSLEAAAKREGIDLLILDNRYSSKIAIRNAETFIREQVDLVIEFQADEHLAAPVISSKLGAAGIPLIAVEIPHPGATYYGANNYAAGVLGGRYLGQWARQYWHREIDEIILLELKMSGPTPASRLTGTLQGIREILPQVRDSHVRRLNGNGQFGQSLEAVRKHLRHSRVERALVGAINDPSAIGALRAFEEAGRSSCCAVVGQNASAEARIELRHPSSRLIGSVAYFPETYGEGLIALGLDIVRRKHVPPAVFIRHKLITPANVDRFYPNDQMIFGAGLDRQLLRRR